VELARELATISYEIQRQVGIIIDRRGHVTDVIVGDAKALFLPEIQRRGRDRLSGLRFIHTHLAGEALSEDDLTDLALLRLDLVAALRLAPDGAVKTIHSAHLKPENISATPWEILAPQSIFDLKEDFLEYMGALEEEFARTQRPVDDNDRRERAVLIHVSTYPQTFARDSLDELSELAHSAGINVVHTIIQRRKLDPRYILGRGKLQAAVIAAMQKGAGMLVFDLNITPSQIRSLGDFTDLKILDRTQVILDIFAQRAVTREGKLQVELAQLRYLLPFLSIRQQALSRLTGGIGGRGPGETRLEEDRRRARDRIAKLEREVELLGKRRRLRRHTRTQREVPTVAVIGYTNAGKSTLLNHLTNSEVMAKDCLFATLNPVSRRLRFPREREIVITDTVGFIHNLPPDLFAAFRTTFEELQEADLLLHIIDAGSVDLNRKMETVLDTVRQLDLKQKPMLTVFNKIDTCAPEEVEGLVHQYGGVPICALNHETFDPLLDAMERLLWPATTIEPLTS
jgi:GTP-binding protein HflX